MYSQASYDLYSMIRGRRWAWITPNNNPWPCPLLTLGVLRRNDAHCSLYCWGALALILVILLLSGDVDFNIQPAEAWLSRVMHIELWAAPDCFSLSLNYIAFHLDFHFIISHFKSCQDYWKSFWKGLGPRRASNENGAERCWLNGKELTNQTCVFWGFVKDNG